MVYAYRPMNGVVTEFAPAKLNLALSVGPPGDDGMHPICSWMVAVDLVDELEVRSLQPGSLSRYAIYWHENARRRTDIDWPIRTDLAVRAHLALQKHTSRELPVQLTALIRTNLNVQELTVKALLTENKEHIYHAAMMDPHTAAELDLEQIWNLVDDLLVEHGEWLPGWARGPVQRRVA